MTAWTLLLVWAAVTLLFGAAGLLVDSALDGPGALPPGWWVPITVLVAIVTVCVVMLA